MTRKEKIAFIKAGIKPEKKPRYKFQAQQRDDRTYDVKGIDLLNNVIIDGNYTEDQVYKMDKQNDHSDIGNCIINFYPTIKPHPNFVAIVFK